MLSGTRRLAEVELVFLVREEVEFRLDLPKGGTPRIWSWNYLGLVLWQCTNRLETHGPVFAVIWGGLKS